MSKIIKHIEDSWKKPSDEQKLSHRTILRYQLLSNELRDDLNKLPMFMEDEDTGPGKITDVLFASRDHERSVAGDKRWYNFRLCGSFNLPEMPWKWLSANDSGGKKNINRFRPLFLAAKKVSPTAPSFHDFFVSVRNNPTADINRKAHELLIDALAPIPYRGVLLSRFEEAFFQQEWKPQCCWFWGTENHIRLQRFDEFVFAKGHTTPWKSQDDMSFHESCVSGASERQRDLFKKQLDALFKDFLLPFTRGENPLKRVTKKSPYNSTKRSPALYGFVVPAYDYWSKQGQQGGMVGWVVFFLAKKDRKTFEMQRDAGARKVTWIAFNQALQTYVRRIREAHRTELLLGNYADNPSKPPQDFLAEYLHHLIGWKWDESSRISLPLPAHGSSFKCNVSKLWDTIVAPEGGVSDDAKKLCNQFLIALNLIHKSAQSERLTARTEEWDRFGHELKHISFALSDGWLVDPKTFCHHAPQAKLAPFPELISAVGAMIYLWSPEPHFRTFLGSDENLKTLESSVKRCWTIASASLVAVAVKQRSLVKVEEFNQVSICFDTMNREFSLSDWWRVRDSRNLWEVLSQRANILPTTTNNVVAVWISNLLRVLVMIMRDQVRHAALHDRFRNNVITLDTRGVEIVCNTLRATTEANADENPVNELRKLANQSTHEGIHHLSSVLKTMGGEITTRPNDQNPRYELGIAIPLPGAKK